MSVLKGSDFYQDDGTFKKLSKDLKSSNEQAKKLDNNLKFISDRAKGLHDNLKKANTSYASGRKEVNQLNTELDSLLTS